MPTCPRVWTVIDELPPVRSRRFPRHEIDPFRRPGEKVRAGLDQRGLDSWVCVNPDSSRGTSRQGLHEPRRIVVGAFEPSDADAVAALYAAIRFSSPVVRSDVNSPRYQAAANRILMTRIVHHEIANVCEATGADVVKGRRRWWGSTSASAALSACRDGYGGLCFPKDSSRSSNRVESGYHFQLLSGRDRGQRAAGASGDRQVELRHLARLAREDGSPARLAFKAKHRRHA